MSSQTGHRAPHRPSDTVWHGVRRAGEWLLLVAFVGSALAAVVLPRLAGATPYAVLTGSMSPGMPRGSLVVVREVDPARIGTGDVITFMPRPDDTTTVTHRVVGVGFDAAGERVFTTKGDANDTVDPWTVQGRHVLGERWYSLPYLGYLTDLLTGRQRELATILIAVGLLAYALVMYGGALCDRLRQRPEVPGA